MEEQEILELKIGTEEPERVSLKPAKVKIVKVTTEKIEKAKATKVIFEVKHPDKEETIKISRAAHLQDREIITSGTWLSLDKQGNIQKNSTLALFLNKLNVTSLKEAEGKEVETELEGKYLSFRAY